MRPAFAATFAAALALLALAACGSSSPEKEQANEQQGPAPADRAAGSGSGAPDPAAPPAPPDPPAPAASGTFPEACGEYRRTVERLARCGDALDPEVLARLRALFERQWAGWEALTEQDRRTLAATCERSTDAVKQAAAVACGW